LRDPEGTLLGRHFVTATSGSGTRGTFSFTVPFAALHAGISRLTLYEVSAANGERLHVVRIPLRLVPLVQ